MPTIQESTFFQGTPEQTTFRIVEFPDNGQFDLPQPSFETQTFIGVRGENFTKFWRKEDAEKEYYHRINKLFGTQVAV